MSLLYYTNMDTAVTDGSLATYTSLKCGGEAEKMFIAQSREEVIDLLVQTNPHEPVWILGYGSNCLISDEGLPGTTIIWRGGEIWHDDNQLIADAGVWWDELVQFSIHRGLWGFELMSEIPSSVGGAVFGNIAAYGQQISDTLLWVEVFDRQSGSTKRFAKDELEFAYRESSLQTQAHLIILQAAFELSLDSLHEVRYETARAVATEIGQSLDTLDGRREVIIETRKRAGSIYHPDDIHAERTAGSFFKNPLVSSEQAVLLARFDESGKTLKRINEQNKTHGGTTRRASAAHVLLAAGFNRGQTWKHVRLHPKHVLKLETLPGATAAEVYDVTQEIITTVKDKLDITITPEVRFLGKF